MDSLDQRTVTSHDTCNHSSGEAMENALYFKTGWDANGEEKGVEGGNQDKRF